ncbi:hypothetical protein HX001_17040 [Empedobacter brevis]|uniref:Uncharacterized protein n=1 Tax=Empedobacter brevis TaxID=247 RepID=A0AAJ1QHM7_9FLAO|nr:hypothetical protein [Empedobacter brevis]MDM1074193.1 hypothetical protein [Empedobacter brevis]QES94049.1 hypothetical protein F0358_15660 [Empedobacter brevis]
MKNLVYIILVLGGFSQAQIAIGKTAVVGSNTLLDFDQSPTNSKGIILPAVTNATNVALTNGTFVFDINTKKVRMVENNAWKDLSDAGNTSNLISNTSNDIGNGVIMGAETSAATGILVLEATDKAMILPKITNPHLTVKSPYAGMMCYDTVSKTLAVFDGTNWNYWK